MVAFRPVRYFPRVSSALDDEALAAIAASELGIAPPAVIGELTAGATRRHISAHSVIHHEAEDAPHLELVISGLVRVHVSAASGRTMTVLYCRTGSLLGLATLYTTIRPTFGSRRWRIRSSSRCARASSDRLPIATSTSLALF
jgi:hypothetical protein